MAGFAGGSTTSWGEVSGDEVSGDGPARRSEGGNADEVALMSVTAHGLLNSAAVLLGSVDSLRRSWQQLDNAQREALLDAVHRHARLIAGTLEDLVRGMPLSVVEALDALNAQQPGTTGG